MTLLADVVATSAEVASTSSRLAKVASLADLLRRLDTDEVAVAVCLLTGEPRQGRFGIGWATLAAIKVDGVSEPTVSVGELDNALDRIAVTTGAGSVAARADVLDRLFGRATAAEADFLRRLLVGELRQGALAGVMVDAVAKASGAKAAEIRRAAMLAGDLAGVAALAVSGGATALSTVGLQPLRPVLPMLAATSPDVAHALEACGGLASVEWKLDGARIQVHRDGDEVRIFTRNLNDITDRLPGIVAMARGLPAESLILDGESMWWLDEPEQGLSLRSGHAGRPERFQELMSRFGTHAPSDALGARFFDILHLDGEDLLDRPLVERLGALDRLAGAWRVPSILTSDPAEAQAFADGAVAAGHEGVMVKAADSRYEAGRRGGVWRKVKPVQTFDLVVLGAEWGHGRRQGWLSNLHLGALGDDGQPVMVGKTFKGLTDELLTWQTAALLERATETKGIAVMVRPELVVEVALDGVQSSTRYPGGLALRFARIRRYRPDKTPAEADSLDSLRVLLA